MLLEGGSAAVGKKPPQYVRSHANTATGRNHDCHTTLTNLFLALWGVTTAISFGIYCCENAIPGVLPCYNFFFKVKKNWCIQLQLTDSKCLCDLCNITRTPEYIKQLILLVSDKVSLRRLVFFGSMYYEVF